MCVFCRNEAVYTPCMIKPIPKQNNEIHKFNVFGFCRSGQWSLLAQVGAL